MAIRHVFCMNEKLVKAFFSVFLAKNAVLPSKVLMALGIVREAFFFSKLSLICHVPA